MMIPLIRPLIPPIESWKPFLEQSFASRMFSNRGPAVLELEKRLKSFIGCDTTPVLVNSCTAGIEAALLAKGVTAGDEVLVPTFTFTATAQAVLAVGAVPVLVDIHEDTWVFDPRRAKVTPKTKAAIFVAPFGYPINYEQARDFGLQNNIQIIVDSASAFGSELKAGKPGSYGLTEVFSFHATKSFGIGEGGAVVTASQSEEDITRNIIQFGLKDSFSIRHGRNYKLSDITAAVGLAVLERFPEALANRRENVARYLKINSDLVVRKNTDFSLMSNAMLPVLVEDGEKVALEALNLGVTLGRLYRPLHTHPLYSNIRSEFPITEKVFQKLVALPTWEGISEAQQIRVLGCLGQNQKS